MHKCEAPNRNNAASNVKTIKVMGSGFDICEGFIANCRQNGLNAVKADFVSFFENLHDGNKQCNTKFHAIFALASMFHLPKQELLNVLRLFTKHLIPEVGVLLTSIPNGNMDELGSDGRWKLNIPNTGQIHILQEAGFKVLHQETVSIYNGNNWVVLVSVLKK